MVIRQEPDGRDRNGAAVTAAARSRSPDRSEGYRVLYSTAMTFLGELGRRDARRHTHKMYLTDLAAIWLLIIGDLGMKSFPVRPPKIVLKVVMRRYGRTSHF